MQVWHWELDLMPHCVRRPKGKTLCRPKAVGKGSVATGMTSPVSEPTMPLTQQFVL